MVGGRVLLTEGAFVAGAPVAVAGVDKVHISGQGAATQWTSSDLADHVLSVTDADDFELSSLVIGHANPVVRLPKYAVFIRNGARARVHHIEVTGSLGSGILLAIMTESSVRGCLVHDTLADGIHFTGASKRCLAEGNILRDTGDDAIAVVGYQGAGEPNVEIAIVGNVIYQSKASGIKVTGGTRIVVDANVLTALKAHGIIVQHDASFNTFGADDVVVSNNVVNGAMTYDSPAVNAYGIDVHSIDAAFPVGNVQVLGNIIRGGGHRMMVIGSGADDGATHDIRIFDNDLIGPNAGGSGLSVQRTTNVGIQRNLVRSAFADGISVSDTCLGVISVLYNDVHEPSAGGAGSNGVKVRSGSPVRIIGNTIADTGGLMGDAIDDTEVVGDLVTARNPGWVTEASDTATILSGTTSITVAHGLDVTPSAEDFSFTPSANTTADPGNMWVDNIDGTNVDFNCRNDPGAGGLPFGWRVGAQ